MTAYTYTVQAELLADADSAIVRNPSKTDLMILPMATRIGSVDVSPVFRCQGWNGIRLYLTITNTGGIVELYLKAQNPVSGAFFFVNPVFDFQGPGPIVRMFDFYPWASSALSSSIAESVSMQVPSAFLVELNCSGTVTCEVRGELF